MELNYLKYNIYKTCPKKYDLSFVHRPDIYIPINKRYAFLGFVLQKLVERFYLEKWWEQEPITRMKQALPLVSQQILEAESISFSQEELRDWLIIANDTIPTIVATIKAEKLLSAEVYVEREEEVQFGEDRLQLRPDFIIVRRGIITLLDGKGGKTVGRYTDDDQLYFYAGAVESIYKRLPHRLGFWWYRHGQIVWLPVTREAVTDVRNRAARIIECIKESRFEATPGQHCRLCDFRPICDEGQKFIASRHKVCDAEIPEGNFGEVQFG